MKNLLLPLITFFAAAALPAQEITALTGKSGNQIVFNDFRTIDLTGKTSGKTIFSAASAPVVFSQRLKQNIVENKESVHHSQFQLMAAMAENASGNLIYSPMYSSNIYVINRKSGNITLVENDAVKITSCDIASHFTRMSAGRDGNIYMLNNAGTSLVRIFENDRNTYNVENLGAVKSVSDDPSISLAVMTAGFGGDMVADTENNLYIFAASGNVFKLNITAMTAEHLGKIKGLPENYSVNGAAVLEQGNIMIASAKGDGFYEVNLNNMQAQSLDKGKGLPVYDLASKNFINENRAVATADLAANIEIYPTKIDEKYFNVRAPQSTYFIEIFDAAGTRVLSRKLETSPEARVDIGGFTQGMYIINIKNKAGKILKTSKVMVAK